MKLFAVTLLSAFLFTQGFVPGQSYQRGAVLPHTAVVTSGYGVVPVPSNDRIGRKAPFPRLSILQIASSLRHFGTVVEIYLVHRVIACLFAPSRKLRISRKDSLRLAALVTTGECDEK